MPSVASFVPPSFLSPPPFPFVSQCSNCSGRPRAHPRTHSSGCTRMSAASLPPWAVAANRRHASRQPPHSGSHFARQSSRSSPESHFFEGWYLRAVLPDSSAAYAWMFSVESAENGAKEVCAQFLAEDEVLQIARFTSQEAEGWYSDGECLRFGCWGKILMGHGIVGRGFVEHGGVRHDLSGAMLYLEKNWGGSFPKKWWWVQANTFTDFPDLTFTAVGARRLIGNVYLEDIGMIAVHLDGEMYEFSNWNSTELSWAVAEWGTWEARATSRTGHSVRFSAKVDAKGTMVLGPSLEGMVYNVRDAAYGSLTLDLLAPDGSSILSSVKCEASQVEVGGGPWDEGWNCSVKPLSQPLRGIINMGGKKVKTSL